MKVEELCKAFCSGLALRPVPIGFAVKTPFEAPDGDAIGFYLRRSADAPSHLRFEDDGGTIAALEEDGVSLEAESRFEAFKTLLKQYHAYYDESTYSIYTDYIPEKRIPTNFAKFTALLLRLHDLRLYTRDRVEKVFKDDVRSLVNEYFEHKVEIFEDETPSEVLTDYVADFVLRARTGETLAVYAASTEIKALEALLLWQELGRRNVKSVKSMALFDRASPPFIRKRTLSRLINSEVLLGTMDGTRWEIARKIANSLKVELPQLHN